MKLVVRIVEWGAKGYLDNLPERGLMYPEAGVFSTNIFPIVEEFVERMKLADVDAFITTASGTTLRCVQILIATEKLSSEEVEIQLDTLTIPLNCYGQFTGDKVFVKEFTMHGPFSGDLDLSGKIIDAIAKRKEREAGRNEVRC